MTDYYDDLETRDPGERDEALFDELPYQIANARDNAPHYRAALADVEPTSISDRAALAALPLTRKSDLIELQKQDPPFGGLSTVVLGSLMRIYQSPGPIYDLEGHDTDYWRTGRAFYAAGFRSFRVIHNAFSYHLTPAGAMVESGARKLG
jgi:phenylacetate-CoA ligase